MFLMLIANILGVFILFFLLWKALKEDYHYEKIFNLSFSVLLGFGLGLLISNFLSKEYWFWIISLGILTSFYISIKKQKMKFFESFEGLVVGLISWIGLVYLSDAIIKASLSSFLAFWICSICMFLFFFLKSFYRSFSWYKSGRVGLAGVLTAFVFFIFRLSTSLFFPNMISLVGRFDIYISGTVALILFLLLYVLAKTKE